ncbi:hypothetical protein THAOC_10320 [Thalassiosira oceanica]|uniref:Uncharacterized protein n=1 Tax=Thalassiosira oceanica TaxID=159749 RepID=K0SSW4_THAOC|nr:hypothetical protein THAOC_10320 [Thalassiosira oceanica]|eukprot:EJK68490.1 hypothetical protein THAOC_10320 [Thalassiosira oceanica]
MAALSLKGSILGKSRQLQEALATVVGALSDLGETIPQTFDDETLERLFAHTLQSVRESSISEVQEFKLASPDDAAVPINRFYDLAVKLSHLLDPNMLEIFACKSVIASMRFGWTKFSCFGLAVFAARVQVRGMFDEGFAIGSSALKALDLFSDAEDQKTFVYFGYYGEIASFHIPLQLCSIELSKLQEECKYQVGIVEGDRDQYFGMLAAHMNLLKNTIDILTGDEPFSGPVDGDGPSPGTTVMRYEFLKKYHHSLRAFWTRNFGQLGLAGYCSPDGKPDDSLVDAAIATLREKEATCAHNFRNKRLLLEAEKFSHAGEMEEADVAYLSAIEAAREARFVHEQGLACELAAAHYSRNGSEDDRCRSLLRQALECYETWGCKPRVEYIAKMIAEL